MRGCVSVRSVLVGFLSLDFEGTALYLHEEDYRRFISKNAIWIDWNAPDQSLHQQYVVIAGTFDANAFGHMGAFSGTIKDIKNILPWPPRVRRLEGCPDDVEGPRPCDPIGVPTTQ
jgi:hypothetical protein